MEVSERGDRDNRSSSGDSIDLQRKRLLKSTEDLAILDTFSSPCTYCFGLPVSLVRLCDRTRAVAFAAS